MPPSKLDLPELKNALPLNRAIYLFTAWATESAAVGDDVPHLRPPPYSYCEFYRNRPESRPSNIRDAGAPVNGLPARDTRLELDFHRNDWSTLCIMTYPPS